MYRKRCQRERTANFSLEIQIFSFDETNGRFIGKHFLKQERKQIYEQRLTLRSIDESWRTPKQDVEMATSSFHEETNSVTWLQKNAPPHFNCGVVNPRLLTLGRSQKWGDVMLNSQVHVSMCRSPLENILTSRTVLLMFCSSFLHGLCNTGKGGARGVIVIVVGNGHGDVSSNTGRDWLHFT